MSTAIPQTPQPLALRQVSSGAVRAVDLLRDRQVLVIEHAGEFYQLRLTKNGKLILTK
jgi:hemin uptake protein HemP